MQDLIEKQKAIDLVTRVFIETDNKNWEAIKACFTSSVRFDMTYQGGGSWKIAAFKFNLKYMDGNIEFN
jgi:hypothetical protein